MRIAIGVATFNRGDLVRMNARSLARSRLPPGTQILVVDDASSEFGAEFLKEVYREGAEIQRREHNSKGADHALYDLLDRLFATGADALVMLDSDMIVASDFADKVFEFLPQANGILSLFNTPAHPTIGVRGPFVLKRTVGSGGTVWPRDLARQVLDAVPAGSSWDWRFCDFLIDAGYEICVLRDSAAQHVGINAGQNTVAALSGDFGVGFLDHDPQSAYFLIEQIGFGTQCALKGLGDSQSKLDAAEKSHAEQLENLSGNVRDVKAQLGAVESYQADLSHYLLSGVHDVITIISSLAHEIDEIHRASEKLLIDLSPISAGHLVIAEDIRSLKANFERAQARVNYLQNRSVLQSVLFRSDGRPVRPLRRLLFHASGKPRRFFRVLILHKNGRPRRAFADWLNSFQAAFSEGVKTKGTVLEPAPALNHEAPRADTAVVHPTPADSGRSFSPRERYFQRLLRPDRRSDAQI